VKDAQKRGVKQVLEKLLVVCVTHVLILDHPKINLNTERTPRIMEGAVWTSSLDIVADSIYANRARRTTETRRAKT
jgi:hypothetical protein